MVGGFSLGTTLLRQSLVDPSVTCEEARILHKVQYLKSAQRQCTTGSRAYYALPVSRNLELLSQADTADEHILQPVSSRYNEH
jgi:hypothetical protein